MPIWLITFLLNLVLRFGIPFIVNWFKRRFGFAMNSQVAQILSDYADEARVNKVLAREKAKEKLKACTGIACPPETKDE